jgi:hypothetical protein
MIVADAAVELSGGQLVVIPLLLGLVAFLGKWWFGSNQKAMESIIQTMHKMGEQMGIHNTRITVLEVQNASQGGEILSLRERQHELAGAVQAVDGKVTLLANQINKKA